MEKFKVLQFDDRCEVVDNHGALVKVFPVRASDGKYAICHAYDRAWSYIESISVVKW